MAVTAGMVCRGEEEEACFAQIATQAARSPALCFLDGFFHDDRDSSNKEMPLHSLKQSIMQELGGVSKSCVNYTISAIALSAC